MKKVYLYHHIYFQIFRIFSNPHFCPAYPLFSPAIPTFQSRYTYFSVPLYPLFSPANFGITGMKSKMTGK